MERRILATPRATLEVLKTFGFRTTKQLGQHFLVDANTVDKIVAASDLSEDDVVLEVGPGIGTLTVALAPRVKQVVAVEKDSRLIPILDRTLEGLGNVEIVPADALEFDAEHPPAGIFPPNKCVSNLPYQVATPLLARYLESFPGLRLYVVMIQKEVAERMLAKPGTKEYGSFTVKLNYYCKASKVMPVSKHVFMPKPEVDSAVIRLERLSKPPVDIPDEHFFFKVIRAAFGQRRKTVKRALSAGLGIEPSSIQAALEKAGVDPSRRGETLSLEEFAATARAIAER
ncbi:MAG: 16S rRNA (adenine(1518)-N(6)/adenine(1519)-N(6))-dimethyltransferase RsmA [Candidatus Aquicultorales bacterium]